eukprot:6206578-Pleurochrysis_carterae.AAC.2
MCKSARSVAPFGGNDGHGSKPRPGNVRSAVSPDVPLRGEWVKAPEPEALGAYRRQTPRSSYEVCSWRSQEPPQGPLTAPTVLLSPQKMSAKGMADEEKCARGVRASVRLREL